MRLKALDQIHIGSVKSESLRPQEEFEVSDELGEELLKKLPNTFKKLAEKADKKLPNKAAQTPLNKSQG